MINIALPRHLIFDDTKVNYIKQSGIDKNLANKVQEIARLRQSRQINIADLFSYTTLINKVGNGSEMYIPTGRSGDRPIETEILAGQDVQLNTELLEMLKILQKNMQNIITTLQTKLTFTTLFGKQAFMQLLLLCYSLFQKANWILQYI